MKGRKILILGYFGFMSGKKDGQTVKTRQYWELLKRNTGPTACTDTFDTEVLHTRPWYIFILLWKTICADKVVYLPAQNNLLHFFGCLYTMSKIFKFEIVYPLIGGWLPMFLEQHPRLIGNLKKIKAVFPESATVTKMLKERFGMKNVHTLPNFRFEEYVPQVPSSNKKTFRLVFMSRIVKAKGIDAVFALAEYFARPEIRQECPLSIDFYGGTYQEDKEYFERMVAKHDNICCYKGILEPDEITRTLCTYDALILPTRYRTEGVPGAIIDAYMAGIPVLVADWHYVDDVVLQGQTGFIVPIDEQETETYANHIRYLFSHQDALDRMKLTAYKCAKEFSEEKVWSILKSFLQ